MNLKEFINLHNGDYLDYDNHYGAQCVDLIRYYFVEVLNINGYALPGVEYAKNLYDKVPETGNANFIKIENTRYNFPLPGDIVVWGWYWPFTGFGGHVAIATGGNTDTFISFDQNYPKNFPCRYTNHHYRGVKGWLRPRVPNNG